MVRERYPQTEFTHPAVKGVNLTALSAKSKPLFTSYPYRTNGSGAAAAAAAGVGGGNALTAAAPASAGGVSAHGRRRRPPSMLSDYVDITAANLGHGGDGAGGNIYSSGGGTAAAGGKKLGNSFDCGRTFGQSQSKHLRGGMGRPVGRPPGRGAGAGNPRRAPLPEGCEILRYEDLTLALVGCTLQLLWPEDGQWYAGVVEDIDEETGEAMIEYDDGEWSAYVLAFWEGATG